MRRNATLDLTATTVSVSRSKKRGRPAGDHKAKSRELIEAARHVIAEVGYTAASLRKVAERLGRTTGSVTYYFASKEEVIESVATSLFDDFDEMLDNASEEVDLNAIFNHLIEWEKPEKRGSWMAWFQLLPHATSDPILTSIFRRRNGQLRAKLASLIVKCQQRGTVRSDFSADLLADQMTAMTDGWIMMTPVEPDRFKPGRINDLVRLSISMLSPPEGSRVRRQRL
jgi:TetR/AcrR family transcriptional regulator, transcriptional repressor of aconitase